MHSEYLTINFYRDSFDNSAHEVQPKHARTMKRFLRKNIVSAHERPNPLLKSRRPPRRDKAEKQEKNERQCKICLNVGAVTKENPLVNPCKCKGSVQFVHLRCLREWMNAKISSANSDSTVQLQCHNLVCEVCKTPLPRTLSLARNGRVSLLDLRRPEEDHIVIEMVPSKQQTKLLEKS